MHALHKILVPTDLSPEADSALVTAMTLAAPLDAALHVLHIEEAGGTDLATADPRIGRLARRLASLRARHPALEGLPLPTLHRVTVGASVSGTILEVAETLDIDLVVMMTHGHTGLRHLLQRSVAEEVARKATCPVLTCHPTAMPSDIRPLRHILVPTDFSDCSQHALMHAKALAAAFGARLTLLYVMQRRTLLHAEVNPELQPVIAPTLDPAYFEAHLRALYASVPGPAGAVAFAVRPCGAVADEIVAYARTQSAGLILIATHGLTGVPHFLMGSVTEQVIRKAECPVFTVKSFGKSLVSAKPSSFKQPSVTSFTRMLHDAPPPLVQPQISLAPSRLRPSALSVQVVPSS